MAEFWKQFFGFWNNIVNWTFKLGGLIIICYLVLHIINGGNI